MCSICSFLLLTLFPISAKFCSYSSSIRLCSNFNFLVWRLIFCSTSLGTKFAFSLICSASLLARNAFIFSICSCCNSLCWMPLSLPLVTLSLSRCASVFLMGMASMDAERLYLERGELFRDSSNLRECSRIISKDFKIIYNGSKRNVLSCVHKILTLLTKLINKYVYT